MRRLEGRTALITGAAGGIGSATARRLAEEGARVFLTDVEDASELVKEIGLDQAAYLRHDVADPGDWEATVEAAVARFGSLDILVNNAGILDRGVIEDTDLKTFERVIAVTQTSVFLGMKIAANALKASPHGSIINISSVFGISGGAGSSPAYHAAKGAVRVMTKNAALHWASVGLRVNSIHPGFIDTAILGDARDSEVGQYMVSSTPMGRFGLPSEIAAAVAFLASDDASFITGSELIVDGGWLAR